MPKSDVVRLRHMLDAAHSAVRHAGAHSRIDLGADDLLLHGILHLLLVLGEAATRVSEEERRRTPGIAWRKIIGMRNRLIHGYEDINLDIVWQVLTEDLPPLIVELERILATKE